MNYAILEDEPLAAEKLKSQISELRPYWRCIQILSSVEEALQKIPTSEAQLFFVDINLGDGLSFSIFEKLRPHQPLIFTTAYDQYALKAFELNSIDYLLKPIHHDDLKRALQKIEQRAQSPELDWQKVIADYRPRYKERFIVSTGEKLKTLPSAKISFFRASGKHLFATTVENQEFLIDDKLRDLEQKLDPALFFQINRSYIVNLNYIQELIPYSKSRLKLILQPKPKEEVIVSVERSPRFKAWLAGENH